MVNPNPFRFSIARDDWADEVRNYTNQMNARYWNDFQPITDRDLAKLEIDLNRQLPTDFRVFLTTFGVGQFPDPFGGCIYSPDDMRLACHGPMLMRLGCSEWASDDDQRKLYRTRGASNPAPDRFTEQALVYDGIHLLDLLQIGTDGCCCYHQLYVGDDPAPFGYCLLTDCDTYDNRADSFSDGLRNILNTHWGEFYELIPE